MRRRLCIVGGGASGASLAWLVAMTAPEDWDVTLLHDQPQLGGHSHSVPVELGGVSVPVDIGVQFVSPALYPHVFAMLGRPEFRARVPVEPMPPLRYVASFTPERNFVNDPARATDPRFAIGLSEASLAVAREFTRDLRRSLVTRIEGRPAAAVSLAEYLRHKPHVRQSEFFALGLIPMISIINGYTAYDILETRLGDLFPLVSKFPFVAGPLIGFDAPGEGWYRFGHGASSWIETMADLAAARGTCILRASAATRVIPARNGDRPTVVWRSDVEHAETFDAVVLTTDMDTNRELLDNDLNPIWHRQAPLIGPERFPLLPGTCFIHRDDTVLAAHLREDQFEDVHFTGSYAWRPGLDNAYDLPYDLHSTFATHLVHNAFPQLKERCYVSMYAEALDARWPDPSKVLHRQTWRHGRWMSSFMKEGKAELHRIQGLGGVWFAGNNTTFDAEEGAVLSAIGVAERIVNGFRNPLGGWAYLRRPAGKLLRNEFIDKLMFPKSWELAS